MSEPTNTDFARYFTERLTRSLDALWVMNHARVIEGMISPDRTYPAGSAAPVRPEHEWTREVDMLLGLAEAACPPDEIPGEFAHFTFDAPGGWKIEIFYDGGDLDYIETFTRPDGTVIDFWDWPKDAPGRGILMAWRGVGDYARLKDFAATEAGRAA